MRRALRFLAATALLGVVSLVLALPASGLGSIPSGTDCLKPPTPQSPVNAIDPGPATPKQGDPFAANATVSKYEIYGYAGLEPNEFDPGCNPIRLSWTPIAGLLDRGAVSVLAAVVRAWRIATDGTLTHLLDPVQGLAQRALGWGLFVPLVGLALLATAITFAYRSGRVRLAETGQQALTSILVLFVAAAALFYPLVIGPAIDQGVGAVITATNEALSNHTGAANVADAIAGNVMDTLVYRQRLNMAFGAENQGAQDEYGPKLWGQSAYTRSEAADITANPAKAAELADQKRTTYKKYAVEMQSKYPAAYDYLAGNQALDAFWQAGLEVFAVLSAVFFLGYGLWKVLYNAVLVRVVTGGAPAVALVAQHPDGQPLFWRILSMTWAALVGAVVAGVAVTVYLVVGIGGILGAAGNLGVLAQALLLLLLNATMWKLMRITAAKVKERASKRRPVADRQDTPSTSSEAIAPAPSRASAAFSGGVKAGAATLALGVVTGGTVTAGAVTAGAAKGALASQAMAANGKPPAPQTSGAALPGPAPSSPRSVTGPGPAEPTGPTPIEGRPALPGPAPAKPAPDRDRWRRPGDPIQPSRVYEPGEPLPVTPTPIRVVHGRTVPDYYADAKAS